MGKDKNNVRFQNRTEIEKELKLDKNFMNSHSAAEFDAFVEGALWMLKPMQSHVDKLVERVKNSQKRVLELESELAPYRELYEDYEMVEKKSKKTKKKVVVSQEMDDEDIIMFQDDDYGDVTGEDFE